MVSNKFLGLAFAGLLAVPIVAFGSGGAPDCASAEVKKALHSNHRIKQAVSMGFSVNFSGFKTLSKDIKSHLSNCECTMSMKMDGEELKKCVEFTAEYNGYNEVVVDIEDMFRAMFG